MYSVLRFRDTTGENDLGRLGADLNTRVPEFYSGPDKRPHRFSCSVSSAADVEHHWQTAKEILERIQDLLPLARRSGIEIWLDLAVYLSDYEGRFLTAVVLPPGIMTLLASHEVTLKVSIYAAQSATTPTEET